MASPGGLGEIIGPFFQPGDRYAAQAFVTGDFEALSSVTVKLQRRGESSGPIELQIWDEANGKPNAMIATLGTMDLANVNPGSADFITFDGLVTGLEPKQNYYVVLDPANADIPDEDNSFYLGTTAETNGTNGAPWVQVSLGPNHNQWASLASFIPGAKFWQASVSAVSLVGDFEYGGTLDASDIDMLSLQLRSAPTDRNYDLNNDGTLSQEDRARWIHGLAKTYFGDANLDGEFNSSDLTAVFEAGEYEDNIMLNSSWSEGDWKGDGDFESGDLIVALADGGYETGPRAGMHTVPEPSCIGLAALAMLGLCPFRRSIV
jgi:hypothetical protein